MNSWLFKITQVAYKEKPLNWKIIAEDVTQNPWITGLQYCNAISWSCHKHISLCSISVFSLRGEMGKWPSETQKITIKWNWCSNGSNLLVFHHFDCLYNDFHLIVYKQKDTLLKIWVFVNPWQKIFSSPKITPGLKLQTLLLLWKITP